LTLFKASLFKRKEDSMDQKTKQVVGFILDNNVRLAQTGSKEWKFTATGAAVPLDLNRPYATRDEAIEALYTVATRIGVAA
jgi:hypothetical protein